jgi:hypothetical protein
MLEPGQHSRYSDWLWAGRPKGWSLSPGKIKNFLFLTSSRPAVGSTQPPIQWVAGVYLPGGGVKPRSRKCGSIHPLPRTPSWHGA